MLADGLRNNGLDISHVEESRPAKCFWNRAAPDTEFEPYLNEYHRIGRVYGLYRELGLLDRDLWVRVPQTDPVLEDRWTFFRYQTSSSIEYETTGIVGSGPYVPGVLDSRPIEDVQGQFDESVAWRQVAGEGDDR